MLKRDENENSKIKGKKGLISKKTAHFFVHFFAVVLPD